jgi:hypothetical protein
MRPENDLPCLDLLAATPDVLRGVMAGMSEEDALWKPAPDRFSVAEVLAHLAHSESHCYRARVDRILEEDSPKIEADDASQHYDQYRDRDPEEDFAHFEEQRETNIEFLRGLPAGVGERTARHSERGKVTLAEILHEWAMHDLGHVRQIAELVRARLIGGAGPFAADDKLTP